jgi:hypothetical protein
MAMGIKTAMQTKADKAARDIAATIARRLSWSTGSRRRNNRTKQHHNFEKRSSKLAIT